MADSYLIKTERLGLRNWESKDLDPMATINADPEVMEFFPKRATKKETALFIKRMQENYNDHGFCYFAVDVLATNEFIGFVGLLKQTYESPFTPCVDIGWRLKKSSWGKGYATEGAKACLEYGFHELGLESIYSVASVINTKSTNVMRKIGMTKLLEFDHPKILNFKKIKRCEVYRLLAEEH